MNSKKSIALYAHTISINLLSQMEVSEAPDDIVRAICIHQGRRCDPRAERRGDPPSSREGETLGNLREK